jgi:hypothetical protein
LRRPRAGTGEKLGEGFVVGRVGHVHSVTDAGAG